MNRMHAAYPPLGDFLSAEDESRVFGRMRYRIARTLLRQTFSQARFRASLVLALTALLWIGLFWMFADGFRFLQSAIPHPETHARTVGAVLGTFFAALLLMLVFSSGIILYGSLFRSPEITLLLTMPARTERVFLHKFHEAIFFSSWGFMLLGSPILLAYGIVAEAPWYYYAMLPLYLVAFIYIPVAVGAIICLWVVRRIPDNRLVVLIFGGLLLLGGAVWMGWSLLTGPESDLLTPSWFLEILGRLQFSEQRLLPSWWLSSGLLDAAAGAWSESILFLALMISNALFLRQLAIWTAGRIYREAYSGLWGRESRRKRARPGPFDRSLSWAIRGLSPAMRLLLIKDLRLFRRDPLQWSQFLIFLGLLALYFLNIRRFTYDIYYIGWVNMVSFLNLSVVGLLMSTFTTRFVFPMISLEGRRFWILGLLPVGRETILWSKFLFAAGGSIIPCSALILLSDAMLNVPPMVLASHQLTCLVLCLGLAAIAVGLGARLPNLREQSPARIAAGFGGTLNLVVSTLYILVVVLLTALPMHFYLAASYTGVVRGISEQAAMMWWLRLWLMAGTAASLLLGALATILPLRMGFRAFRKLEF